MHLSLLAVLSSTFLATGLAQIVDPSSVDGTTKAKWCSDQKSSCPLICLQTSSGTKENRCDPDTLVFSCICSDNTVPNSSEYSLTVPFYECQTSQDNCVSNCNGDSSCQSDCREKHPCGAQNPTRVNTSTISSTESPTAAATGADASVTGNGKEKFTGFGGAAATASSKASRQAEALVVGYGRVYGLVTVLGGLAIGSLLML